MNNGINYFPLNVHLDDKFEGIIAFYNDERPHMSIGNQTPSVEHTQSGPHQKMLKNPWENYSN